MNIPVLRSLSGILAVSLRTALSTLAVYNWFVLSSFEQAVRNNSTIMVAENLICIVADYYFNIFRNVVGGFGKITWYNSKALRHLTQNANKSFTIKKAFMSLQRKISLN